MKTIHSKLIVFLLICFFTFTSCSAQKLVFEHIGISDKPLPTIEININHVEESNIIHAFVVDRKTFELYENYTKTYFEKNIATDTLDYDYGTYKVTLYSDSKTTDYFLESKEKSYAFFNRFIEVVNLNEDPYKTIWYLLRRLK